jgi:glycosyltransferase involved in cell wall biosynthesis
LEPMTVSVVRTTVNRAAVRAAVMSALNQTVTPLEVIVAVDSADGAFPAALDDIQDKIRLVFSGGIGPSGARMRAVQEAKGEIIAFLDDDDYWFANKLERQLAVWPTEGSERHKLASSRIAMIGAGGKLQWALPFRLIEPGERIPSYLFRRSRVRFGEGLLHTSTLMCDRDLLTAEPWDVNLHLHTDWDWMVRVGARTDVDIVMSPDILVGVSINDNRSVSRSADWRLSLEWVQRQGEHLTPRERGDFLLVFTAVKALWNKDRRGAVLAARYAVTSGRPGFHAWLVWGVNMLSLELVAIAMRLRSRVGQKKIVDPPQSAGSAELRRSLSC